MAVVRPFRAVRYDTEKAGRLERLVAPPYDVIDDEQRAAYRARSPYNVVYLTLPDRAEDAAAAWSEWLREGILVRDEAASSWVLEQDYVGPDGIARTRRGIVASLRVEPYERRVVLPHERTHREPKEDRLRLLRAVGAQLEPILLVYDGPPPATEGEGTPELTLEGARLWRDQAMDVEAPFSDLRLLIADGHHRYETALAFHEGEGTSESAWLPVVLVSSTDPGLAVFPTHRVFSRRPAGAWRRGRATTIDEALAQLHGDGHGVARVVQVTRDSVLLVEEEGVADVELVDRLGHEGISYTPDRDEAVRRVESGEAAVAYLLRPTPVEEVFRIAERGGIMPQKSTYFYPKLLSGLLFQPLD
jgi:uncharacterized protein (DUF1015 family)